MSQAISQAHRETEPNTRQFLHFLDTIDGVVSVPACITGEQIAEQLRPHQLRFPLLLAADVSLGEQLLCSEFAPASSRFGPLCDNVLGMNWQTADGRIVRIGERVAKTTTGYDLFRFLLNSGNRFGIPRDIVLRVRPDCGHTIRFEITGALHQLCDAIPRFLQNSWMHWFDTIDLVADGTSVELRVHLNCLAAEAHLFESFVAKFAAENQLVAIKKYGLDLPHDGCPDFVIKTTPDRVPSISTSIASEFSVRTIGLCFAGAVLGYIARPGESAPSHDLIRSILNQYAADTLALGGDCFSRHLPPPEPSDLERRWIETLQEEADWK